VICLRNPRQGCVADIPQHFRRHPEEPDSLLLARLTVQRSTMSTHAENSVECAERDGERGRNCDADVTHTRNSLILKKSPLFPEIFSLLICVGNSVKNRCSAAVSLSGLGSQSLKIAKFPVKFPVSRELARRRVRSALRRQPGILHLGEFPSLVAERPANGGLF
jgi:hypothetical protein